MYSLVAHSLTATLRRYLCSLLRRADADADGDQKLLVKKGFAKVSDFFLLTSNFPRRRLVSYSLPSMPQAPANLAANLTAAKIRCVHVRIGQAIAHRFQG
jgi:hypothetical protein